MTFQTQLAVILSLRLQFFHSLAQHCIAGARDGRTLANKQFLVLGTSNPFVKSESDGNSTQSDRTAFVSRVQGVFGS